MQVSVLVFVFFQKAMRLIVINLVFLYQQPLRAVIILIEPLLSHWNQRSQNLHVHIFAHVNYRNARTLTKYTVTMKPTPFNRAKGNMSTNTQSITYVGLPRLKYTLNVREIQFPSCEFPVRPLDV